MTLRFHSPGLLIGLAGIALLAGGIGIFLSYAPRHDALFEAALLNTENVTSYTQDSKVRLLLEDRTLEVQGIYRVDRKGRYASWATSTLFIPGEVPREFLLENVSFGEEVYMRLTTKDPYLEKSIAHSPEWRHFSRTTIPPQFVDIAVWGPIIDNLLLFSEEGAYLEMRNDPVLEKVGEQEFKRYDLVRAKKFPTPGSTLAMLLERADGASITVWIDPGEARVHRLLITKEGYESDTLFLPFGEEPIVPPL
jgi:hypothetical protein